MFTFLLIVQTLIAFILIVLILMQRSEGGGLAGGGSPAGMMSARGASDFLTRGTAIMATIFVVLSIALAGLAANQGGVRELDPGLLRTAPAPRPAGQSPAPDPTKAPPAQPAPAGAPAAE